MKKCTRCGNKRKNKYFNPNRPKDMPDWCEYCALDFVFMERYKLRRSR